MGSVYRRGKQLWISFAGLDGARVRKASGYRVGQELLAKKLLWEIEERIEFGAAQAGSTTLEEFGRRWAAARIKRGAHTNAKLDSEALENHLYGAPIEVRGKSLVMGKLALNAIKEEHVTAWLEHLEAKKLAGRTRSSYYSLLSRLFKRALREEMVLRNPCSLERGETPQQIDKDLAWRGTAVFSMAELEALISDKRIPLDRRVFYALGFLGGLREGEISALRWSAYDDAPRPLGALSVHASYTRKNKREKSPKNKLPRRVPVHPAVAELLKEWKESGWASLFSSTPGPTDLLVPNRAGTYVTDLNVGDNFKRDLETLGFRHRRFHDTRRTFVTFARVGGASGFLRWVTHGPKKREMQDTYSTPPWEVLCADVLKVSLSSGASKNEAQIKSQSSGGNEPMPHNNSITTYAQGEIRSLTGLSFGSHLGLWSGAWDGLGAGLARQKPGERDGVGTVSRLNPGASP